MTTDMPRVIGMLSAEIEPTAKDLVLTVKGEDGSSYKIPLHAGVVGGLPVALFKMGGALAPETRQVAMQIMHLNGVNPAVGLNGELILDLILENGLHFPVTFPPDAIPGLQTALAELQKVTTAKQSPPSGRRH